MGLDLTPITRAEMKIARLELADDATVEFIKTDDITGNVVVHILTQDDDWDITAIANLYINVDFLRFRVLDFDGFSDILAQTEKLKFDGVEYKMERKHIPIGLNRVWDFKLEPLGDFPE